MHNIILSLDGAAHGRVRVVFTGYDGGPVTPRLREQLHDGLDRVIRAANGYATVDEQEPRALDR